MAFAAHVGWVSFDVALVMALLWLVRNWRAGFAAALAGAAFFDSAIGLARVVTYNVGQAPTPFARVIIAFALAAPLLAALFFGFTLFFFTLLYMNVPMHVV